VGRIEGIATITMVAAAAAYAAAFGLLLARRRRAGFAVFVVGWGLNAALVALNWVAGGHPPFGNMYHVMVFLSLCFLPLYLLLRRREGLGWLHLYFAAAAVVPLAGALFMERDILWRRMPALHSPWFVPHVVSYMISYALAAVAFALTVAGRVRRVGKEYADASYAVLRFAFPFMTFGLLSGALWAEEAWGAYWSWDPKETWSLITWTAYVACFHCRSAPRLRPGADLVQALAFLALLTTFLLVNLLPKLASVLHGYA